MRTLMVLSLLSLLAAQDGYAHGGGEDCMHGPMAQFGRYIGDWRIHDETLSREDGKTWTPGNGARWTFECIGHGAAIQDYWRPSTGGFGTNLRSYNAATGRWDVVWTSTRQPGLMRISGREDGTGRIVMTIEHPKPPQPRRIIFYPPDATGWDWAMQWSSDDGETWFDVYRIRATPWADE